MAKNTAIKLFSAKHIRTHWYDQREKWYFYIVDGAGALT